MDQQIRPPLFAPASVISNNTDDFDSNDVFTEYFYNDYDDPLNLYTCGMANYDAKISLPRDDTNAAVSCTGDDIAAINASTNTSISTKILNASHKASLPTGGIRTAFHKSAAGISLAMAAKKSLPMNQKLSKLLSVPQQRQTPPIVITTSPSDIAIRDVRQIQEKLINANTMVESLPIIQHRQQHEHNKEQQKLKETHRTKQLMNQPALLQQPWNSFNSLYSPSTFATNNIAMQQPHEQPKLVLLPETTQSSIMHPNISGDIGGMLSLSPSFWNISTTTKPVTMLSIHKKDHQQPLQKLQSQQTESIDTTTTWEEMIKKRRKRNRQYAFCSRVRKQFIIESLQCELNTLQEENIHLRTIVQLHIQPSEIATQIINECCTYTNPKIIHNTTSTTLLPPLPTTISSLNDESNLQQQEPTSPATTTNNTISTPNIDQLELEVDDIQFLDCDFNILE